MKNRLRVSHYIILFGLLIVAAVVTGWWLAGTMSKPVRQTAAVARPALTEVANRVAHLYFGDRQGQYLMAEQRVIEKPADPVSFCRSLVEALIEGPRKGGSPILPLDAGIRAVYLLDTGTAVVDFKAAAFAHHPGGVTSELLSVYAIVNTLVLNNDAVRNVKLLIGGREADTLAGHVTLEQPYKADMLWVR